MKSKKIKSGLLCGVFALMLSCSAWQNSTLPQITKPYLGEYECKSATLGKKDLLEDFDDIVLHLKENGTFVLRYAEKNGKPREEQGTYTYDAEKKSVRFALNGKREMKYDFPLDKGILQLTIKMGGRTLCLQFEQK